MWASKKNVVITVDIVGEKYVAPSTEDSLPKDQFPQFSPTDKEELKKGLAQYMESHVVQGKERNVSYKSHGKLKR